MTYICTHKFPYLVEQYINVDLMTIYELTQRLQSLQVFAIEDSGKLTLCSTFARINQKRMVFVRHGRPCCLGFSEILHQSLIVWREISCYGGYPVDSGISTKWTNKEVLCYLLSAANEIAGR